MEITILHLAEKVIELTNSKSEITFLPPLDEGDMSRRNPDTTKMKKLLDKPMMDLETGIIKLLEKSYYLQEK